MSKFAFFRQSGWMVIATTLSGVMMSFVHKIAKWPNGGMSADDYTLFLALLQVLSQMTIPAVGLQLTMVQMAVAADANNQRAKLAGAARALLMGTFLFWAACALLVFLFQNSIRANYRIASNWALWGTVLLGLTSLWSPVFFGILQGRQNFFWLGTTSILNGCARLGFLGLLVFVAGATTASGIFAAIIGMIVALSLGAWQVRDSLAGPVERFDWMPWLKCAIPMILGYGVSVFMLTEDMVIVRRYFLDATESELYGIAGTLGRAVFFLLAPLTTVMFPKIAQSAAKSESSTVLAQALGITALMGVGAALLLTLMPELPLRILYSQAQLPAVKLIPTFAWCLLPLPLANVLVNNLLARQRYGVVPWLLAIAAAYYFTLRHVAQLQPQRLEYVLWTIGAFGVLLFVVCLGYTLYDIRQTKRASASANA